MQGHFLFVYRYFEVAEMFGREIKTQAKHEQNRGITRRISYVLVSIISLTYLIEFANYGIYRRITGEYNTNLENWTYNIIPGVFILSFCTLLLVALLWVLHSLRHDKHLMGNEKWMAAHFVLLTILLGSYIWFIFFAGTSYTSRKIYAVINTIVYTLMASIMYKVNGPQYTVWANRKFVGRNTEEVAQHILQSRESNDGLARELNINQTEDREEPETKPIQISSDSIFQDLKTSRFGASIDGIAEVDPMGACLLTLLSKPRPFKNSRDSIPITYSED
jgi:hypothetical protein